jgi:ketosteroid isomerase-like protein
MAPSAADNVELVRRGFEAMSEGGVEGMLPFVHAEFEVTTPASLAAEPDTYRGHEGVRRWFDSFYDAVDEIGFEAHDYRAVGEKVVVPFTMRVRGRSTGIEAEQSAVQVWEIRDDKAFRMEIFATVEEAMEALGAGD